MKLHIDFETASELNLLDVGAYRYAAHPSTFVRCMAWAIDDGETNIWIPPPPRQKSTMPDSLKEAIQRGEIHAWNANFERLIWQHCMPADLPNPTFNQWRCSSALARVNGLPGTLADCARVLGTEHQKMDTRVMKKLADARYTPLLDEMTSLMLYCQHDVRVEREIESHLSPWTDDELFVYQINEHINDRGIKIDELFCGAMLNYLDDETERLNSVLCKVTHGAVERFTQVERLKQFVAQQMGFTPDTLDKNAIIKLLALDLPINVRSALKIRRDGAKSSTAKYRALLDMKGLNSNRVRGLFIFAGAGQTGRFSSQGPQLHNLVRDTYPDVEDTIAQIKLLHPKQFRLLHDTPIIHVASRLIRPALIADTGKQFIIGDWSAVEAKAIPYLADEQSEVEAWRTGRDRYIDDAVAVFHCEPDEVDDHRRQVGKVTRLACGFGGKKGALLAMAEGYGLTLSLAEADTAARAWHAANPWAERYGRELETAALRAVSDVGSSHNVRTVTYRADRTGSVIVLRCTLPSGRVISYHDVKIEESPFGGYQLSSIKPRETLRERLWFGLLAENVTQAFCNDFLRHALALMHACNLPVVAHVHDEIVAEVALGTPTDQFKTIMETVPDWAPGFPLTAKVHTATRYTK
jgi:DNA polymerase